MCRYPKLIGSTRLFTSSIMFTSFLASAVTILTSTPPVLAVLVCFVVGYVAIGIPLHLRAGGAARDIWGTAAGLCVVAAYAFFVVNAPALMPHERVASTTNTKTH
jgi:hypothetical protein